MAFELKEGGIHELFQIEWRVNKEKRMAHGYDLAYLQGKNDGLRIARVILFGDDDIPALIASSHFAQTHDIVAEEMRKDGILGEDEDVN